MAPHYICGLVGSSWIFFGTLYSKMLPVAKKKDFQQIQMSHNFPSISFYFVFISKWGSKKGSYLSHGEIESMFCLSLWMGFLDEDHISKSVRPIFKLSTWGDKKSIFSGGQRFFKTFQRSRVFPILWAKLDVFSRWIKDGKKTFVEWGKFLKMHFPSQI